MIFSEQNVVDQIGIHYFSYRVTKKLGHICRLNQGPDVGIDAVIELVNGNEATGSYIFVQIKLTSDAEQKQNFTFYVDDRHQRYWMGHRSPVIFCAINYIQNRILIKVITEDSLEKTEKHWKLDFDGSEELSISGAQIFSRLARPDPADALMRRLSRIAKLVSQHEGVSYDEFMAGSVFDEMSAHQRELGLLVAFAKLDRARYGAVVDSDITALENRVRFIRNECSYTINVAANGM